MLRGLFTTIRKTAIILTVALLLASLVQPLRHDTAQAISAADWRAGNIISDSIFFNSTAMSPAQIQNFLNAKVPTCDTSGSQMHSSGVSRAQYGASRGFPAPYTCLKDYAQDTPTKSAEPGLCNAYGGGRKSSSQIIYDVAQICGINPQVLLVLLQKEQSLVTDDWPWSDQYQKATGFGCPDTAPCDTEYAGFFNQVYHAGRIYKKYARDANLYNYRAGRNNNILFNPSSACGASSVYIENQATAGLYNYTPYQPNAAALGNLRGTGDACSAYGNRNFWVMFNDWFGSTQGSSLVRTPSSPTYYLLTAGTRYAIPSGDILYAYGIENMRVDVVSDSYLSSVSDGGMLGTLFTIIGDPTVYLADGGNKHGIASGEYCTRWGLACGNSNAQKVIGMEIYNRLGQGGVLQAVMNHRNSYYLMENGTKRHFLSPGALTERGYSTSSLTTISNWTNAIRPFGTSLPQSNSFVKFNTSSAIYLYTNNSFYAIPDYETFLSWRGPNNPSYLDPSSSYNTQPPTVAGTLNSLISNGGDKFLIDGGRRISLTGVSSDWPTGLNTTSLNAMLGTLPIAATANSNSTFRVNSGAIFKVTSQQKRPFNSIYDFLALNQGTTIQLLTTSIPIPQGPLLLAEGSGYKISGSDAIYLVGKDSKSYAFRNVKQISDFRTNMVIPTISSQDATQFTYQGLLNGRITDSQNKLFVVNNGFRFSVSGASATNWGFSTTANQILSDQYIERLPLVGAVTDFTSAPGGTIFTHGSGSKRAIATFQKYLSLGGNNTNTVPLPAEVADALPNGSPVF